MSRFCTHCPTSRMPDHVRHLHELEPGTDFRFQGEAERFQVIEIGNTTCKISSGPSTITRRITPRFSEPREFQVRSSGARPCAPGVLVEPLNPQQPESSSC